MRTLKHAFAAALLISAVGCSGSTTKPAATPTAKVATAADVSKAALDKFNAALQSMAQHDKARDWSDPICAANAQMFLDAAKEQGDKAFVEAIYDAGLSNQRCNKVAEAKGYFKQALEKDPKFHWARVQLALYAFAESGEKDIDTAIGEMRQAAVVDSQFKNVEALVNLAMLYIKRNNKQPEDDGTTSDLVRAKKYLQSALAVDDGFMPAFNQLAILYFETAKQAAGRDTKRRVASAGSREKKVDTQALELAALVCEQAIRKNGSYAPIHNTAGIIQVELAHLNSAVAEFGTARKLDPSFYEAHMNYAAVNLQFRGFTQAEEAYRAALRMKPNDFDAHLGLALALRGAIEDANFDKNVKEASEELTKAKQLAPDRAETYYNEAILTQEYKAKSGANSEAELVKAKGLFGEFVQKAGGASEFADAVKRSRERISEIDQIIEFNKQTAKEKAAAEADRKTKAAEAEAKGEEGAGAAGAGDADKAGAAPDDKGAAPSPDKAAPDKAPPSPAPAGDKAP